MNNTKCILPINLLDVGLLLQATDFTGIHHKWGDGRFATCISITNPSIVSMWISNTASQGGRNAGILPPPPSVQCVGHTFNVLWEVTKAYICSTSLKELKRMRPWKFIAVIIVSNSLLNNFNNNFSFWNYNTITLIHHFLFSTPLGTCLSLTNS